MSKDLQVTIQAATSVDGFIATVDGGTDWVQDWEAYELTCREYGCIAMGRTTYDEYGGPAFDGVQHIVLSSQARESKHDDIHFVQTVEQALAKAKELGFDKLLVIGGGQTNGAFMRAGVVQKLMLDIHPIILGQGKKLLGDFDGDISLLLASRKQGSDFVTLVYKVS